MCTSRKERVSQQVYSAMKIEALVSSETSTRIYKDCMAWRATSLYYSLHRHLLKVQSLRLNSPEPGSTFQAFLGRRRFGTLFTRDRHVSLIWARWIHSTSIVYPSDQFLYLPPLSALVFQAVTFLSNFHSQTVSASVYWYNYQSKHNTILCTICTVYLTLHVSAHFRPSSGCSL